MLKFVYVLMGHMAYCMNKLLFFTVNEFVINELVKLTVLLTTEPRSLVAVWIVKDAKFLHVDNEDSDQTARMRWLI